MIDIESIDVKLMEKLECTLILFVKKKKGRCFCSLKVFRFCNIFFKLTFNNAHLILTKSTGKPVYFITAGLVGFKNSHKSTPLATRALSLHFFDTIQHFSNIVIQAHVLGYGGRLRVFFAELRAFFRSTPKAKLMWISSIERLPLNGCKADRRVL